MFKKHVVASFFGFLTKTSILYICLNMSIVYLRYSSGGSLKIIVTSQNNCPSHLLIYTLTLRLQWNLMHQKANFDVYWKLPEYFSIMQLLDKLYYLCYLAVFSPRPVARLVAQPARPWNELWSLVRVIMIKVSYERVNTTFNFRILGPYWGFPNKYNNLK